MNGTTTKRSLDGKGGCAKRAPDESPQANTLMKLLQADFYRSFAIGFALGAVVVFTALGQHAESMVPSAIAAPAAE